MHVNTTTVASHDTTTTITTNTAITNTTATTVTSITTAAASDTSIAPATTANNCVTTIKKRQRSSVQHGESPSSLNCSSGSGDHLDTH